MSWSLVGCSDCGGNSVLRKLPTSARSPCRIEDIESEATQASIGIIEARTLINGLFGLLPELIQIHYVGCLVCGPKVGIVVAKSIRNV